MNCALRLTASFQNKHSTHFGHDLLQGAAVCFATVLCRRLIRVQHRLFSAFLPSLLVYHSLFHRNNIFYYSVYSFIIYVQEKTKIRAPRAKELRNSTITLAGNLRFSRGQNFLFNLSLSRRIKIFNFSPRAYRTEFKILQR